MQIIFKYTSLILAFRCFLFNIASAQSNFQSAGVIHRDQYVTVELQYKLNDPCASGSGKPSKYRFVIKGTSRGYDHYLNWWMQYYNCNKSITVQSCNLNIGSFANEGVIEYIDWTFAGYKIEKPFYGMSESPTPLSRPSYTIPIPKSVAPTSITGATKITYGEQTTLEVGDGDLGTDAQWKWYEGSCGGQPLYTGKKLTISPTEDKTYFVRAESPTDITTCASVVVKVALESQAADHIDGKQIICIGETSIPLIVAGGKLGKDAEWVWYQDSIGANFIAKGKDILVSPQGETVYWVRAESSINITAAKSIRISVVSEHLKDPDAITGKTFVCKGNPIELKVSGGQLSRNASWCWYKNTVSASNQITKGGNVTITPEESALYIVRGEGVCSFTSERSITVNVGSLSSGAYSVHSSNDPDSKRKTILSVSGGSLGNKANWVWYRGSCEASNKVGTGDRISIKTRKKTVFYVRAVGECNTTTCVSSTVYPRFADKFTFINFGVVPSFSTLEGDMSANVKKIQESPVVSLTFGKLAAFGWYIRGKYSAKTRTSTYSITGNTITDFNSSGSHYVFNGNTADNRWGITLGFAQKLNKSLFALAGLGYGHRDLMWGVSEYSNQNAALLKESWGKNTNASYAGVEAEATLLLKVSLFNIALGINGIAPTNNGNSQTTGGSYKVYTDCYVGVGISF